MKRLLSSIIALVIAAALVIAVGVGSSCFTNWQVKTWFNNWGKKTQQPADPDASEDEPDGMIVTPNETNSKMRMNAARSASDQSSCTLTVTYEPSYAIAPLLTWSVAFNDPNSAWATGKTVTDYVAVSASGTTATVKCNEAFGEQVIVTASMTDKPDVSATCTVDYRVRYLGTSTALHVYKATANDLDLSTTHGNTEIISSSLGSSYLDVTNSSGSSLFAAHEFVPVVTVGTIDCTLNNLEYYVKLGTEFASGIAMRTQMMSDCNLTCPSDWVSVFPCFEEGFDFDSVRIKEGTVIKMVDNCDRIRFHVSTFFRALCPEIADTSGYVDVTQWGHFRSAAYSYLTGLQYHPGQNYHFEIKIVATLSDGTTVTDMHKVLLTIISTASANSMSFDQSGLTF